MSLQERINDARDQVRRPGKFEGEPPIAVFLYDVLLNGDADDEAMCGLAQIGRWLIEESDAGFIYTERHTSSQAARSVFLAHVADAICEGDDDTLAETGEEA